MPEPFTPVDYDTMRKAIRELLRLKSPQIAFELYIALKTCRKNGWDGLRIGEVRLDPFQIAKEIGYDRRNSIRVISQLVKDGTICPVSKGVFSVGRHTKMTHDLASGDAALAETMTHSDDTLLAGGIDTTCREELPTTENAVVSVYSNKGMTQKMTRARASRGAGLSKTMTHSDDTLSDMPSQDTTTADASILPSVESKVVDQYSSEGMTQKMTHDLASAGAGLLGTMTHEMTHASNSILSRVLTCGGAAMAERHEAQGEDDILPPLAMETPALPVAQPGARRSTKAKATTPPMAEDMESRLAMRIKRAEAKKPARTTPTLADLIRLSPTPGADTFWTLIQEWPKNGLQRKRTALDRWLEAIGSGTSPETILEAARQAIRDSSGMVTRLDIWLAERGYEEQTPHQAPQLFKMKELEFA